MDRSTVSSWAIEEIAAASEYGLVNGYDHSYSNGD
ncbi:S-layer homology domain-containing protein [Paenibacillus elgii]